MVSLKAHFISKDYSKKFTQDKINLILSVIILHVHWSPLICLQMCMFYRFFFHVIVQSPWFVSGTHWLQHYHLAPACSHRHRNVDRQRHWSRQHLAGMQISHSAVAFGNVTDLRIALNKYRLPIISVVCFLNHISVSRGEVDSVTFAEVKAPKRGVICFDFIVTVLTPTQR